MRNFLTKITPVKTSVMAGQDCLDFVSEPWNISPRPSLLLRRPTDFRRHPMVMVRFVEGAKQEGLHVGTSVAMESAWAATRRIHLQQ